MDADIAHPPSKKQSFCKNQGLDIISDLQNEILHLILSYVSIEDAARTCILSKRWLNLRSSSPTIIWVDKPSSGIVVGLEVIDRNLNHHDPSNIEILKLMLSSPVDFPRLSLWLLTAKTHNVKYLCLNLNVDHLYEFPKCLYKIQSLVELRLSMRSMLKAPRSIRFPNLRSLHLAKVIFSGEASLKQLLTSCPVLEDLELDNCEWQKVRSLGVSMLMLKTLTLMQNSFWDDILNCDISFSAPNLSSFNCFSNLTVGFWLDHQISLESASIEIDPLRSHVTKTDERALRLLTDCQNVKYLSLSAEISLHLSHPEVYENIPTFYNLIRLEVNTKLYLPWMDKFLQFLVKLPKLEFLDLAKGSLCGFWNFIDFEPWEVVPSCFGSSLKMFSIVVSEGSWEEMELLGFLLRNAIVLQYMIIYLDENLTRDIERMKLFGNQVNMLPKASESCVIEIHETPHLP